MAFDKATEQTSREVQPPAAALLPSNTDYKNFSATALPSRLDANQTLVSNGLLNDLQFNYDDVRAPGAVTGNPALAAEQSGSLIDYPFFKTGDHSYSLGADWEQSSQSRLPSEKFEDFLAALGRNAANPENYKHYAQDEVEKFIGIREGLNIAKENTKAAAASGWKALTDGTVYNFLSTPNAINEPLSKALDATLDAVSKDPEATNKVLKALGSTIAESSEHYSGLGKRDQGHLIGETMFGLFNPEGSTETAEAALKVADTVATHVDKVTVQTILDSRKAIEEMAKTAPEYATQAKQMLLDYLSNKGFGGPELEFAGVPKGYFDGMQPSEAPQNSDNILKMVGRTGEYTPEPSPKFLDVNQNRVLNIVEMEKFGGAEKLQHLSPEALHELGLERFQLPKLRLENKKDMIFAATDGVNNAFMSAHVPEEGALFLDYVKKGYLPDGTGAHFLAEALKAHDALPAQKLVLTNIANEQTLEAFRNGVPAAESKLGKFAIKTFNELGLTPKSIRYDFNPQTGILDIIIDAGK